MASKVEIVNLALQKLGVGAIADLSSTTPQGLAANRVYDIIRQAELRKHPWNFAIKRTTLAAETVGPEDGDWSNRFLLPVDCLRVLKRSVENIKSVVEGQYIYSNEDIYYLRYVYDVTDTGLFDPLFVTSLAFALSVELCDMFTDNSTKKKILIEEYKMSIRDARRYNAFENMSYSGPTDPWINARL